MKRLKKEGKGKKKIKEMLTYNREKKIQNKKFSFWISVDFKNSQILDQESNSKLPIIKQDC